MIKYNNVRILLVCLLGVVSGMSGSASAMPPDSWSGIPTKTVKLFYPGQSTYQWLRSKKHKRADKKVIAGDSCVSCHEDEEADIGNLIVTGKKIEPTPIPGKQGVKDLNVQAAYDDDYLYMRYQWRTQLNREGRMHNMIRYDGKSWKFYGSHRTSSKVTKKGQPALYEDRLAIIIDDGSVKDFASQGCWVTCHNGMRDTQDMAGKDAVKAHPHLGKALKKKDVRKYLPNSRTDSDASWDKIKSAKEIEKLKAKGEFLDLMQWRAARSNPVGMADDGYVLDYRLFDEGKKMFSWNVDKKTMTPKYMFDKKKTGYVALREEDLVNQEKVVAIIKEDNAQVYDPKAGFKAGDILPGRLLSRKTVGSAGDNDDVKGDWKDGQYTVIFRRKLDTGHPQDDKTMKVGGTYHVGLAVHDDNVTTRFHHVAFPLTLGIGVKADITAVNVK